MNYLDFSIKPFKECLLPHKEFTQVKETHQPKLFFETFKSCLAGSGFRKNFKIQIRSSFEKNSMISASHHLCAQL